MRTSSRYKQVEYQNNNEYNISPITMCINNNGINKNSNVTPKINNRMTSAIEQQ